MAETGEPECRHRRTGRHGGRIIGEETVGGVIHGEKQGRECKETTRSISQDHGDGGHDDLIVGVVFKHAENKTFINF